MKKFITILLVVITTTISAQTGMDSIMFIEINNLRTNPKSYIPLVKNYIDIQYKSLESIKNGKMTNSSTSGEMTNTNGIKNPKIIKNETL